MADLRNNGPQNSDDLTAPEAARDALRRQARISPTLGSPFMGLLMAGLAERIAPGAPFTDAVLNWPGRAWGDALALRIAGGLHALARSGRRPALTAAWPGGAGGDPVEAALAAMQEDGDVLLPWLAGPPQTNEVGRSSILLGGALHAAERLSTPFELLEIGASAGLNLMFDRWRHEVGAGRGWGPQGAGVVVRGDWRGAMPPLHAPLLIAARAGCDLAPADMRDPAARARMLAYIWPDQRDRLARAEAAMHAVAAADLRVEAADAAAWTAERLSRPQAEGVGRMLVHTIMWQYMSPATKAALRDAIAAAAARATADRPLVWLRAEPDGAAGDASIRLTIWPEDGGPEGGRELGRADFHGRWVQWHAAPRPIPDGGPGA